jgi:hypothetical protein
MLKRRFDNFWNAGEEEFFSDDENELNQLLNAPLDNTQFEAVEEEEDDEEG